MRPSTALLLVLTAGAPFAVAGAQTDSTVGPIASALPLRPAVELRRAGARYAPVVRTCYEREGLLQDPTLRGRLEVGFTVASNGAISAIAVDTLEVRGSGMREVARCVADEATRWHFSSGAFAPEAILLAYDLLPPERSLASDTLRALPAAFPPATPDSSATPSSPRPASPPPASPPRR